ncbi:hypothetical protein ACFX13_019728 [Malus domestica]
MPLTATTNSAPKGPGLPPHGVLLHACPYKRSIVNNHRRSDYDLTGSQRQRKQNRIQTKIKIPDLTEPK